MDSERDADTTYARVQASFGPNAARYTTSPGHADHEALARLVARLAPRPTDIVLDIGTGAGHTALAFAPAVARVVALDLTRPMLAEVQRNARARDVINLSVQQGAAESLPFADAAFDLVSCRLTTHHFAALPRALSEMARVLRPDGRLLVADTMVPEDNVIDRAINEIETLRDASHVRNWRPSEWRHMVEAAQLRVVECDLGYYDEGDGMDFDAWTTRIGTPPAAVRELRRRFADASPALVAALRIERRGDTFRFALPRLTLIAAK
ncbi:MAG: methyltransferase domain-containing protein [Deltaproteobacteria bacterium]|nr:methyltransferase domain-containing protein [Deltaproteobacteria bacterium]